MSRSALVLAAHGSATHPAANEHVRDLAERVARRSAEHEVVVAFHAGTPTFATVLDTLQADEITIVPVMTSRGHYADEVLPREIARNRRFASVRVYITPPVGHDPRMAEVVARRAIDLMERRRIDPRQATLAIVGHGGTRQRESLRSTFELAGRLANRAVCDEVLPAFLDADPRVDSLLERRSHLTLIVEPFLIGSGMHATRDIPAALGLGPQAALSEPLEGWVNGCRVVCDSAVGTDPAMIDIILDLAEQARLEGAAAAAVADAVVNVDGGRASAERP